MRHVSRKPRREVERAVYGNCPVQLAGRDSEHEELVGCPTGLEGFLETILGDGGFDVSELWHIGTFVIKHPYNDSGDSFLDNGLDHLLCHLDITDESSNKQISNIGACILGCFSVAKGSEHLIGSSDN